MTEKYRKILDNINKDRNEAANDIRDGLNALKELWETSDCVVAMEDIRKSFHILTGKQINQTELFDVLDGLHRKR